MDATFMRPHAARAAMRAPLLVAILAAGCLAAPPPAAHAPDARLADAATLATQHDHAAAAGHDLAVGLSLMGLLPLDKLLAGEPGRASDIQFRGDLAAVAVNGGSGGFVLLDAKDPPNLTILSRYRSGSEDNWYVKFTPDGKFVLLTANGNFAPAPAATSLVEGLSRGTPTDAARGLQLVDVRDAKAPRLASAFPAPVRVINAWPEDYDGTVYVFATVVEDRAPVVGSPGALSNYVQVLKLDEAQGTLAPVARWTPERNPAGDTLVHDVIVETHPVTGQRILYAAGWDSGAWLVDVTDPSAPRVLSHVRPTTPAVGLDTHTVKPHPGLVGGRHLTLMSPETFAGAASGDYVLLDTTDPRAPRELSRWALPGNLTNDVALVWSPHEFSLGDGRAFTSNDHGGVWVLDLAGGDLTATAAWQRAPPVAPRASSLRWSVDAETAVWREGLVYDVDMGAGILVLRPS